MGFAIIPRTRCCAIAPGFTSGTTNGTGAAARFNAPEGVGVDNLGNIYVADTGNHAIRKITPAGVVTTFAGLAGTSGSADGAAGTARFKSPVGIMVDSSGNLGVADTGNHIIRALNSVGFTFTVAGTAGVSGSLNGVRGDASFNSPRGIYLEGSSYIIVDSSNHSIRKIYSDGTVLTVAGLSGTSGTADGLGDAARFNNPTSICNVASRFYIADRGNQLIRGVEVKLFFGQNDDGDTDGQPDDNNGGPTGKGSKCSWKYIYFNYTNFQNFVSRTWFATSVTTGNQPNPPPATPVPLGIFAPVGTYANTSPPFPLSPSGYASLNRTSGNGSPGNWVQSSTAAGAIAIYNFDAAILANLQGLPDFVVFTINVTVNSVVQPSFKLWLPFETLGDFSVDLWPYLYTVPQVSNGSNGFDSTILITLTSYDLAYRKDTCTAN